MIETTIFRTDVFKSSDIIYNYLKQYGLNVVLIGREVNDNSNLTHFHCLLDNTIDDVPNVLKFLIFREVRNVDKTITYFIKGGKYKTYNNFVIPSFGNLIDEQELIIDLENGLTYLQLFKKYGKGIRSYTYLIKMIKLEQSGKNIDNDF